MRSQKWHFHRVKMPFSECVSICFASHFHINRLYQQVTSKRDNLTKKPHEKPGYRLAALLAASLPFCKASLPLAVAAVFAAASTISASSIFSLLSAPQPLNQPQHHCQSPCLRCMPSASLQLRMRNT